MGKNNDDGNKGSSNSLAKETANQMDEWKTARGVLQFYDDKLHDLRKYGFSLIATLLSVPFIAQTITSRLTESAEKTTDITQKMFVPGIFNLGVFVLILLLILAMNLFDKNYRVFQQAANTRARVIERNLNLELSDIITVRHGRNHINHRVAWVYTIFVIAVGLLGIAVLWSNWVSMAVLIAFSIFVGIFNYWSSRLGLKFENEAFHEDWTISPLECSVNDKIRISLNNLGDGPINFTPNKPVWTILNEYGEEVYTYKSDKEIKVDDNHLWVLTPGKKPFEKMDNGIYKLRPREWKEPLPISIIVHGPGAEKTAAPPEKKG